MKNIRKRMAFLFLCMFSEFFANASPSQVQAANRRTAVRCLNLAKNYLSSSDFDNAISQSELGLSYDSTVSDLWYIKAAAMNQKGEKKADVLPLVMKSLTEGEWVDYNRDGARILYADMLCDTGVYEQALAILDSSPMIYNADAEFIRAKSYYRLKTEDAISKAREKINSARKIYSSDLRFPELFFKNEYFLKKGGNFSQNSETNETSSALVQKIADSFIAKMPEYDNPDSELEVYAAIFASGEKQVRLLQAFSSHGLRHPLYAGVALENNLMTQQEAIDYFFSFADEKISLEFLEDFLPHITDESAIESVKEHLNAFSGLLTLDTNGDFEAELFVNYSRGRSESFYWDSNNDGIEEWSVKSDFGVPETVELTEGNLELLYGTYPYIVKAVYKSDKYENGAAIFNLLDETFAWSPCDIKSHELFKFLFDVDFYVPFPKIANTDLNTDLLIASCSSYEVPTSERENAKIRFSVLDGKIQSSEYFSNETRYAFASFKNGLPDFRTIDNDGDGIFETTEYFGFDPANEYNVSEEEENKIVENIFGLPSSETGFYVKMIQIDQNEDTLPDFTEEYLPFGGKIATWDHDKDGNWDLRYKKYPRKDETSALVEDSEFRRAFDGEIVTVTKVNGDAINVRTGKSDLKVTSGILEGFFWIGEGGSADDEYFVMANFDSSLAQGISVLLSKDEKRFLCVKIGEELFCEMIPPSESETILN